jgi:hypothetical protein
MSAVMSEVMSFVQPVMSLVPLEKLLKVQNTEGIRETKE